MNIPNPSRVRTLSRINRHIYFAILLACGLSIAETEALAADPGHKVIPPDHIGATLERFYTGGDLVPVACADGAMLRCPFQKMEGHVTREGLSLRSTTGSINGVPLRVAADSVERKDGSMSLLEKYGDVQVDSQSVRWHRACLDEEYAVSADGVQQDFIVTSRPKGNGRLIVNLKVHGALAKAANRDGAQLILSGSGRVLSYSRLKATDAEGSELKATILVVSPRELAIVVDDTSAKYPVRIDPTFSDANWVNYFALPGANGVVYAAVTDTNGNIYIGGVFTNVETASAMNIAKWNGQTWSALGQGVNSTVYSLAVDSAGNVYAGGSFTAAGDVSANGIAEWNGIAWSPLGAGLKPNGFSAPVRAMALDGMGNLYAAGSFYSAGGVNATNIARWNGSSWSRVGFGIGDSESSISALALDKEGNVYAGGLFNSASGVSATNIAKWNGSAWSAVDPGLAASSPYGIEALALDGSGNLYAGGSLVDPATLNSYAIARWDGSDWSVIDPGFVEVKSLGFDKSGNLDAGGQLSVIGGVTNYNGIAKWDGSNWSPLTTGVNYGGYGGNTGVDTMVWDANGFLYAAGNFSTAGGEPAFSIARWDGARWFQLGSKNVFGLAGSVYALACDTNGNLYAGGLFGPDYGDETICLAKWNGTGWVAIPGPVPGPSYTTAGYVQGIASLMFDSSGNLYAAGGFTIGNGVNATNIAKWNGDSWSALGANLNGECILTLAQDNSGNLYAGGYFGIGGGVGAANIAKWNGSSWSRLGSGISYFVDSIACDQSGNVYAVGQFGLAGGVSVNSMAEWNGSAWSVWGSGGASVLASDGHGNVYAGGVFQAMNGVNATNLAKWNGNAWSAVGLPSQGRANITALAFDNLGNLYASGLSNLTPGSFLAKWDGTNWYDLGSGLNGQVNGLVFDGNGNLYAGGIFSAAGTTCSSAIAEALLSTLSFNLSVSESSPGAFVIRGLGTPNYTYALDLATNLTPPINWIPQATNTSSTMNLSFTNGNLAPAGYYRTRYVPQ